MRQDLKLGFKIMSLSDICLQVLTGSLNSNSPHSMLCTTLFFKNTAKLPMVKEKVLKTIRQTFGVFLKWREPI